MQDAKITSIVMNVDSYPKGGPWDFTEEKNVFVMNKLNQERMFWNEVSGIF